MRSAASSHRVCNDKLVAYSWDRAMNRLDWQWPAYLPMTKAAVRAMDAVQELTTDNDAILPQ